MRKESRSRESNRHRPLSTSPTPYQGARLTHKPNALPRGQTDPQAFRLDQNNLAFITAKAKQKAECQTMLLPRPKQPAYIQPRQNTRRSASPCYCFGQNNLLTYSQGKTQGGVLVHVTASARTSWLCYIQPRQITRHSTRPCYYLGQNNLLTYIQGKTQGGVLDYVNDSARTTWLHTAKA